jgi:hypothetical protein
MRELNTDAWQFVGETTNSRCYMIEPDIMLAVPHPGTRDTEASARENVNFQVGHYRSRGLCGVILIMADRIQSLDKEARRVYQEEIDGTYIRAAGMIGVSLLARAIGSFLIGLSKPKIPFKLFSDLEPATAWARQQNRAAAGNREASR